MGVYPRDSIGTKSLSKKYDPHKIGRETRRSQVPDLESVKLVV